MLFKYKAVKNNGEKFVATRESVNKFTLYNEIKAEGNMLITANEADKGSLKSFLNKFFGSISIFNNVSTAQKIAFAKNLSAMTKAGLSLSRVLSVIQRQSTNVRFKNIVENINLEIKKGRTLSEALRNYPNVFSNLFISMTKAGEESGNLSESLNSVTLQMEKTYRLQSKIKGAMIYPAVIISVMITVGILMFIFVVPGITETFTEMKAELPGSTKVLIFISDFLSGHWLASIFIIIAFFSSFYFALKTTIGKRVRDFIVIRLPLVGELVEEANSARVARTLSSLLVAGVPIAQSIQITKDTVGNYYYRKVLEEAIVAVEKGENISGVFMKNAKYYPVYVGEMMAVGEETGNTSNMLEEVALLYENDVEDRTKDVSTIIEPVLMVIIGIAVAFFAMSMIAPIYSMMDNV